MEFNQSNFSEGFTRQYDPTRISKSAYPLMINGRVRNDMPRPILKPLQLTQGVPTDAILQGLYTTDTRAILFAGGSAYYRDFASANESFVPLNTPLLSSSVQRIYAELVPASFSNLQRTASSPTSEVSLTSSITGSPAAVVCQDGINQPVLIFIDGTSRVAQSFGDWTTSSREYVPIGKQMLYDSTQGILRIVSEDRRKIFNSVSGRPLDFVVPVDVNGNKVSGQDANLMAHSVSYDPITAIHKSNTETGFIVCTERASWIVYPTERKIFGEFQLANQFLFDTGAINQFSLCELLGDTALIDISSVRSFNAIQTVKNEGRNSPFSRDVNDIFEGILQDESFACSIPFDNYSLFSVKTLYGNCVLVHDNITQKFVGIDVYSGVGAIKQFAEIKVNGTRRLLFITTDNKLYEFAAGSTRERCTIYLGEHTTQNPKINLKPLGTKCVFVNPFESGTVNASLYVDGKFDTQLKDTIKKVVTRESTPISLPFGQSSVDAVNTITFPWTQSCNGWKFGVMLQWDFDVSLSNVFHEVADQNSINTFEQQQADQAKYTGANRIELSGFTPLVGQPTQLMRIVGSGFNNVTVIKIGTTVITNFQVVTDNLIHIIIPTGVSNGYVTLISDHDEIQSSSTFSVGN